MGRRAQERRTVHERKPAQDCRTSRGANHAAPYGMQQLFRRFAHRTAGVVGTPFSFLAALALIVAWVATGPIFHFSDTWQLVINTVTNVVTFWMVFIIQNSQNSNSLSMNIKLDAIMKKLDITAVGILDAEDEGGLVLKREKQRIVCASST